MLAGVVHHEGDFMFGILAKKPIQISQIVFIHCDDIIVIVIVLFRDLPRLAVAVFYTFFKQNTPRRRIQVIPDFLSRSRCRRNLEIVSSSGLFDHILQNIFRHRASANIAMADKKNAMFLHDFTR